MWSSIIRSQRFVGSYYTMSSKTRSRFMIAVTEARGPSLKDSLQRLFIFSSSYEEEKSSSLPTNLDMTIPSVSLSGLPNVASVHGLIGCTTAGPFIVCNPSMRKVTILPYIGTCTYLGYDPVDAQFKALRIRTWTNFLYNCAIHDVLALGTGESLWRRKEIITAPYTDVTKAICINGFIYYGAETPAPDNDLLIVCFDVRYEMITFIKVPAGVSLWDNGLMLIEYKEKLACIVTDLYTPFCDFDLWILEDVTKEEWSKQTFKLPFSLGIGHTIRFPGTNKAGEIIFARKYLSGDVEPFHIFYYNVERKDMRRVNVLGFAESEELRCRYGISERSCVFISPEHIESIASL